MGCFYYNMKLSKSNIIGGILIYGIGDSFATLVLGEFVWARAIGIALLGATMYAWEVPKIFAWFDKIRPKDGTFPTKIIRAALATFYFNPIWIARHFLFLNLFEQKFTAINWDLLSLATTAFIGGLIPCFIIDYIIQNHVNLKYRFIASSLLSMCMAIYYAFSKTIFN